MTRRALGRGLSALLSDGPSKMDSKEELREVDIDLIDPNPDQPRTIFSEEKLEELSQSIQENGLVQPILLRRKGDGRFQLVAGERRWRAAQRIGMQQVSAIIRDVEDEKLLEIALIENIQRQELNPIEEAAAYQRLMGVLGMTQEEVAKRVGKDRSSVANYVRLLKLPASVQRMLEGEQLSMGHARALLGLEEQEEQAKLAQEVIERKLSVRETERAVQQKAVKSKNGTDSTQVRIDANIRAAELKLKRFLGTQVKILLGAKGGKIGIEFSSASELDRIYSILMRKSDPAVIEIAPLEMTGENTHNY
jgi:ParB family transcriptional regulator, chromosome partitioning protein